MKNKIKYTIGGVIVIAITIYIAVMFISYHIPAKKIDNYNIMHPQDDTLRIAFIGDSWAFFHKLHSCQMDSLIEDAINKPVKVLSEGTCGATSKFIYSRLGANEHIQEIMKKGPNYCIIAAGVNDTHLKIGEKYYLSNMKLIIDFMLQHDVIPIILEIPNYDIYKVYDDINPFKKVLRQISMTYTNSKMDCRNDYRQALRLMLNKDYYSKNVLLLKYDDWNSDANNDIDGLYRADRIHLNDKGYEQLDSCLSILISSNYLKDENHM